MTITLVGDSHHVFLGDYIAQHRLPVRFKTCSGALLLEPFAALNENGDIDWSSPQVKEKYGDPLKNEGVIGVSIGCLLTVLANDAMWREFAPWRVSSRVGLRPVSDNLFGKFVVDHAAPALSFLDLLASARFDAFAIEPPPLKRRHQGIKSGTAPHILREVDTRWRLVMRDEYRKRNIRWIEAPAESFDVDGFLKDEFDFAVDVDPHHANARYAALIVPQFPTVGGSTNGDLTRRGVGDARELSPSPKIPV